VLVKQFSRAQPGWGLGRSPSSEYNLDFDVSDVSDAVFRRTPFRGASTAAVVLKYTISAIYR